MSVRIITDSASDMSPAEHPALAVLPLSVTFGTDVYMDGVDIDHQRFYEMLVERDELPKTGQVNPYAFSQAIAEVREAGDEAVIITVGAKLSGTNQSARTALAEAPGGDVFVVDSNNVTLGECGSDRGGRRGRARPRGGYRPARDAGVLGARRSPVCRCGRCGHAA